MEQFKDPFQEIPDDCIPKLKNMLESDLPQSMHAYHFLKAAVKWKTKKPHHRVQFLAPFGDFSDGTFFLSTNLEGFFCSTVYSSSVEGRNRMLKALTDTKQIDWQKGFLFTCLEPEIGKVVGSVVRVKAPNATHNKDIAYYMEHKNAMELTPNCREGYRIGNLQVSHAAQINEIWPHKGLGTEQIVADTIEVNWGLGVFDTQTDNLVAWVLLANYGGLGIVTTVSGHTRKGLASAVVKAASFQHALNTGDDVHLNVVGSNEVAHIFFKNLGFKPLFNSLWIFQGLIS